MHSSLWPLIRNGCVLLFFLLFVSASVVHAAKGDTTLVSVSSEGTIGEGNSDYSSISSDGRYVAFGSFASNLVEDDTNGVADIFVQDRQTGETTRVSVASNGTQGVDRSGFPSISSDGRYVAFYSLASNLVANDTNDQYDIFVHDRQTGETTRVSVASDGTEGNNWSLFPSISSDGRYVAFVSFASNLVANDTNGNPDIFVHDRLTDETTRVSVASGGTQGGSWSDSPSISSDGRYVAFRSASNLVANDTNDNPDIFVHDRLTGATTRVSIASDGTEADWCDWGNFDPSISSDGRYVAFGSCATTLVADNTNGIRDVFVHDRQTGETTWVSVAFDGSEGDDVSYYPSISSDGRYVAFSSDATNLVEDDTNDVGQVFVHDYLGASGSGGGGGCSLNPQGTLGLEWLLLFLIPVMFLRRRVR